MQEAINSVNKALFGDDGKRCRLYMMTAERDVTSKAIHDVDENGRTIGFLRSEREEFTEFSDKLTYVCISCRGRWLDWDSAKAHIERGGQA